MSEENKNIISFKYNMSFYYQSTIIYFVVFILYAIIRGEFVEDSFKLLMKDPIVYFFAVIVSYSLLSLIYNFYKDRHLKIEGDRILLMDKFKTKFFTIDQIEKIKISQHDVKMKSNAFRLVRIKLKNRRRPVIIRPNDYENEEALLNKFLELKQKLENH